MLIYKLFPILVILAIVFSSAPPVHAQPELMQELGVEDPVLKSTETGQDAANKAQQDAGQSFGCDGSWWQVWQVFTDSKCFLSIINSLLDTIRQFFAGFLYVAAKLLDIVMEHTIRGANYNANQPIINIGWTLVRDAANIVIVVMILAIAVGTILEISQLTIKQALPKLLIAGLLVNFSLPITGVVIDISNVISHSFWQGVQNIAGPNGISALFASSFKLNEALLPALNQSNATLGVAFDLVLTNIIALILIGGAFVLFLTFAIMLVIRMIILWIVLIFSPLAFVAMAVPSLSGYAKQWRDALIEQATFAPALLFFVWLVAKILDSGLNDSIFAIGLSQGSEWSILLSYPELILNYVVLVGLLFAGLVVARKLGAQSAALGDRGFAKARGYAKGKLWDSTSGMRQRLRQRAVGRGAEMIGSSRAGQFALRRTSWLGTGAAVQKRVRAGQEARAYRRTTDADTMKGRTIGDQARMIGGLSQRARVLHMKNMSAGDREKLFKELRTRDPRGYERLLNALRAELTRDERRDKRGGVKEYDGFEMSDVAKSLAPIDLKRALQFKNAKWETTALPAATAGTPDARDAQQDINDLLNGMTREARGNALVAFGSADTEMGKYFREYFTKNGTLEDMTATRKTVDAANAMLQRMMEDKRMGETAAARATQYRTDVAEAKKKARDVVIKSNPILVAEISRGTKDERELDKLIAKEQQKEQRKLLGGLFGDVFSAESGEKLTKEMQRMESILLNPSTVTPRREKDEK